MANPYNFQITPIVENNEINFRSLYLHHITDGPNQNINLIRTEQSPPVLAPHPAALSNWPVYDGPGRNATLVARAQGLHIYAGNNTLSLVFEDGRFKGSTLQVMGVSATEVKEGEWAIVGGTGQFARATGVISKKRHEKRNDRYYIIELAIHAICPLPKGSLSLVPKIGPFGGDKGTKHDIAEAPRRLESITVCHKKEEVIHSIAFSYIDRTDQKRTVDPWGGSGGERYKIKLDSSEFVKEVSGTFDKYQGSTVITSLKFVTNVETRTHPTLGDTSGKGTPFSVPVQDSSVVGFFGRAGKYLDAVGVYVHPF